MKVGKFEFGFGLTCFKCYTCASYKGQQDAVNVVELPSILASKVWQCRSFCTYFSLKTDLARGGI